MPVRDHDTPTNFGWRAYYSLAEHSGGEASLIRAIDVLQVSAECGYARRSEYFGVH